MRLIDADAFERHCMFDRDINDMQDVIYALRDYPTIDAEPVKHGHWIDVPNGAMRHWKEKWTEVQTMNIKGYKVYSDSTLMKLPKRKIIELLRVAEHNYFVTDEALDNSAQAGQKIASEMYAKGYHDAKEAMTAIYGLRGADNAE